MKLTTFCALTIFAAMAQLKPSEGLNLEVSINAAKDIETDIGRRTPTDLYGRTKAVQEEVTLCEDAMWKQFKKCKCFKKCMEHKSYIMLGILTRLFPAGKSLSRSR